MINISRLFSFCSSCPTRFSEKEEEEGGKEKQTANWSRDWQSHWKNSITLWTEVCHFTAAVIRDTYIYWEYLVSCYVAAFDMFCRSALDEVINKVVRHTWAKVATINPKHRAICGIDGSYPPPHPVVLAMPTETRRSVPKNSATSIRHMFRLSVMSCTPTISLTPVKGMIERWWEISKLTVINQSNVYVRMIYDRSFSHQWVSWYRGRTNESLRVIIHQTVFGDKSSM